jgi:two-component system C4-dicarboxylate transport sensor histidine kinase DctB
MEPERSLLRLTHEKSAFFNVGVAILGPDGARVWSEPQTFLASGWPGGSRLVDSLRRSKGIEIVSAPPAANGAILYVATPILRGGLFTGALVGAIDLVSGRTLERAGGKGDVVLALTGSDGKVVYPPTPDFAQDPGFQAVGVLPAPFVVPARLAGRDMVVAGAPVQGTDFTLLSLADAGSLFGAARRRLVTRLLSALAVASLPLVALIVRLRSSLATFRSAEEALLRDERLRSLGAAVDLIAHEVKNALNGLRVGLDLIVRGERDLEARKRQAVGGLRTEIERLSDFTSELLSFSKGVVPRPTPLELGAFVRRVVELTRGTAETRNIALEIRTNGDVRVRADSSLVHVVVANLVGNALDFAGGSSSPPRVVVTIGAEQGQARVRVSDNGPGVSPTVRPRLFEPFVTGRPSGVGIGLAFSRTIARAHGGDLALLPEGPETTFELTLPLEAP